jgi:gamma-glutamylcyclotransferase (GGCT)/AIG2-like uncharacterized protein YtfP
MTSVFTYGSLIVPEVWALVAGRRHGSEPAILGGYKRRALHGVPYPGIFPAPAEQVEGILWHGVEPEEMLRLDDFEGDLYERITTEVNVGAERIAAEAYVVGAAHEGMLSHEPWDEARFRAQELDAYLEGCRRFAASLARSQA